MTREQRKERFRESVKLFLSSDRKGEDYFQLILASSMAWKNDSGFYLEDVLEILTEKVDKNE